MVQAARKIFMAPRKPLWLLCFFYSVTLHAARVPSVKVTTTT